MLFSSPCLGILFSQLKFDGISPFIYAFSSPCLGILFSPEELSHITADRPVRFSSPCLGILFSHGALSWERLSRQPVFVPMFGDSFFTNVERAIKLEKAVFVPMFGDSFFTPFIYAGRGISHVLFLSPCLGILFSRGNRRLEQKDGCRFRPHAWGFFFHIKGLIANMLSAIQVFVPMFGDSFFT